MDKIRTIKQAQNAVDEAARQKLREEKAKNEKNSIIKDIFEFMSQRRNELDIVYGERAFAKRGPFKAMFYPSTTKDVIDNFAEFIKILKKHPEFAQIIAPTFSLSGKKVTAACKKAKVANILAPITNEVKDKNAHVKILEWSAEDRANG